ncbi:hypothetical protein Tco_0978263 [Tanacetum coccineum]|uniref:Uncharacterized protein n=1 Tax=Tanacetum coccineum TaxID=301880 RepID=A0ABQ5EMF8_9ASTR
MEDLKQHYLDEMLSLSNDLQIKDYRNEKIDIHFRRECESMIDELKGKFNGMSIKINKKKELRQLEQAAKVSSQYWKSPIFYDDDDEESSIPLRDLISEFPLSESDEFINLVFEEPFVQSSRDTSGVIVRDDESLSDEDVSEDNVKIYSNPLSKFEIIRDEYITTLSDALLVTPLSDANEDECFDLGGDVDENFALQSNS